MSTLLLPVLGGVVALLLGLAAGLRLGRRSIVAPTVTAPRDDRSLQEALRSAAAAEERERIYKDLHDDLGAKLLQLVYATSGSPQADLARSVLQDLRDIVSRARRPPGTLLQILGEIQLESEQRLAVIPATLDWQQSELPDVPLDQSQTLHLLRICREAVSNAIRHGHAQWLRVRISGLEDGLLLDITDDGSYHPEAQAGRGTSNMRERASELQGDIRWDSGTMGGTKVTLRFPLKLPPAAA